MIQKFEQYINESESFIEKFMQYIKDNPEVIEKMNKGPWARTLRKFEEVFKDSGFYITQKPTKTGKLSSKYYLRYKDSEIWSELKTIYDFMDLYFK